MFSNELLDIYEIREELGRGSFGIVYRATHRVTGISVAIKQVMKSNISTEEQRNRFMREISIMKSIDHPFTAAFFDLVDTPEAYYIVLEYIENENLLIHITRDGPINEPLARKYFAQLISVLDYLHNYRHIAHRDLKAENIMLDKNNNLRVVDFGLSNVFTESTPLLRTACGSTAYAAPEMLKGQKYSSSADIWSAGIVLYSMVTGKLPFMNDNVQVMIRQIITSQPEYPPTISIQLNDILHKMLMKSPQDRITLKRIKEHPWFSATEHSLMLSYSLPSNQTRSPKKGFDKTIVDKMAELGLDTSQLQKELLTSTESSPLTVTYQILRRTAWTSDPRTDEPASSMVRSISSFKKSDQIPKHDMLGFNVKKSLTTSTNGQPNPLPKPVIMKRVAIADSAMTEIPPPRGRSLSIASNPIELCVKGKPTTY